MTKRVNTTQKFAAGKATERKRIIALIDAEISRRMEDSDMALRFGVAALREIKREIENG